MHEYNIAQWFIFFVIYCFAGWCWETSYVSIREKKLTNRGFLAGPYIPIYGSGAIIILFFTLPVKNNLILVFIIGMIAASLLEYFTGAVMEAIFKVKYWDYSNDFLNINGYICLKASVTWGVFSVLMIKFVHKPVEKLVLSLSQTFVWVMAVILVVVMATDTVISVKTAINLKIILERITEHNDEIRRLQKRLDVLIAVAEEDRTEFVRNLELKIAERKDLFIKSGFFTRLMMKSHPTATSERFKEAFEQLKEHVVSRR